MSTDSQPNDWVAELAKAAEARRDYLEKVEELAPTVWQKVLSAVGRDVSRINSEIYNGRSVFEVSEEDEDSYSFTIEHNYLNHEVEVSLLIEDGVLEYTFRPSIQSEQIRFFLDKENGLNFIEGSRMVSFDEISRRLLEPIIRAEFRLSDRK